MTFQKGRSGNPAGRRKAGESLAELIREYGDKPFHSGGTMVQRMVQMAWNQAAAGDDKARAWLADRAWGKVRDEVDLDVTSGGQVVFLPIRARPAPAPAGAPEPEASGDGGDG